MRFGLHWCGGVSKSVVSNGGVCAERPRACISLLSRNDPMGAGTSAPLFVELQKPLDASDLENYEDARNEVVHLRRLLAKAAVRLFSQNFLTILFFLRLSCEDNQQDYPKIRQDKGKARTRQGQDKGKSRQGVRQEKTTAV